MGHAISKQRNIRVTLDEATGADTVTQVPSYQSNGDGTGLGRAGRRTMLVKSQHRRRIAAVSPIPSSTSGGVTSASCWSASCPVDPCLADIGKLFGPPSSMMLYIVHYAGGRCWQHAHVLYFLTCDA